MLTVNAIKSLAPYERLSIFDELCLRCFGDIPIDAIADRIDYSKRSIYTWRDQPGRIPTIVLLYLQQLENHNEIARRIKLSDEDHGADIPD